MRAGWSILVLLPWALCANVPKTEDRNPLPDERRIDSAPHAVSGRRSPEANWSPLPFSRYEGILNRRPFGQPPPAPPVVAVTSVVPLPPAFSFKLTLCAINRTPAGSLEIGFVDGTVTPPRSYCMDVGESQDGFTALSADFDREYAVIEKGGSAATLWLPGADRRVTPAEGADRRVTPAASPAVWSMDMIAYLGMPSRLAKPEATTGAPSPPPMFTNTLENLLSMELSVPLGLNPPPLPISGDLSDEAATALGSVIVIEANDTEAAATQKEEVGRAKEELRAHLQNGGTTLSYLQSLRERRDAECARQTAAREAAEAQIRQLSKKLSQAELHQQLDVINKKLAGFGVDPIDAPDSDE